MIGQAELCNGLYVLQAIGLDHFVNISHEEWNTKEQDDDGNIWHLRLEHPSDKILQYISNNCRYVQYKGNHICDVCHYSKQHRIPFKNSLSHSNHCFDMIHTDIWGPFSTTYVQGYRYFFTVVDDYSRYTWIFLMKSKAKTRNALIRFINLIYNQFNCRIKVIRSDNGNEFAWNDLYDSLGILHQTSCVETPQQNFVVERKHQHILNVAHILMIQSKILVVFWSYAIIHAIYLLSRIPSKSIENKTPYELIYNQLPDLHDIKVFGSLCFVSTLQRERNKLGPRAKKCVFLSYKAGTKGYIVLDILSREINVSRNVIF